jgi:hypothetical protein
VSDFLMWLAIGLFVLAALPAIVRDSASSATLADWAEEAWRRECRARGLTPAEMEREKAVRIAMVKLRRACTAHALKTGHVGPEQVRAFVDLICARELWRESDRAAFRDFVAGATRRELISDEATAILVKRIRREARAYPQPTAADHADRFAAFVTRN